MNGSSPSVFRFAFATCALACATAMAAEQDAAPASAGVDDAGGERIVVTATLTPHDSRSTPATLTVLTHEELISKPSQDVLDALRGVTGVSLQDRGVGGRRVISLRGMESRHTLFLVDGRRISASDDVFGHSDYQYDWVPLDAVERIEIIRGPLSSLYGSEALGGVVNVITRPAKGAWRGNGSLVYGETDHDSGSSERLSFLARGSVGDFAAASVNLGETRRAAVAEAKQPWLSRLEDLDARNWGANLHFYPADGQRIDLSLSEGEETRWRDAESSKKIRHRSFYDLTREQTSLRYRADGSLGSLEARAYRAELGAANRTTNNVTPTSPQTLIDEVMDLRGSFGLGKAQWWTAGVEARDETLLHNTLKGGRGVVDHDAVFVQNEISLSDELQATLGLRQDRHGLFGKENSPRAYLVWLPNEDWSLKVGAGHGFRAPSLKQISPDYRFPGPYTFIGNPDLTPETSDSLELGAEFSNSRLQFSATLFDNRVEDLIAKNCLSKCSASVGALYNYINLDEARIRGIELGGQIEFSERLTLSANYTGLNARDVTRQRDLPERPEHALNLEARYGMDRWEMSLRMQANSEQLAYENNVPHTLSAFTLWHVGLRYSLSKSLRFQIGIDNVADHDFRDEVNVFAYNERGRMFWVGLDFATE